MSASNQKSAKPWQVTFSNPFLLIQTSTDTWHKNRHVSQFKTCCLTGSFWALLEQDDQDSAFSCKNGLNAAFLQPQFDHKASLAAAEESGVEGAEARQMLVYFRSGGSKMFYVQPCSTQ